MPELPEVETVCREIAPQLSGQRIDRMEVRQPRLRWPVAESLPARLRGRRIVAVERRAKYLLLLLDQGSVIIHLGMSGTLRTVPACTPPGPHDHVDIVLGSYCLRLHDPRRFGAILWGGADPLGHELLRNLAPEPLSDAFHVHWLSARTAGRRAPIKSLVMDATVVAGVGNIYANEALFRARIHPARAAGRISEQRLQQLVVSIKEVLTEAIQQGGTTLRDFRRADGRPGYFAVRLQVYARQGQPCPNCGRPLKQRAIGQRSSFFCATCQR